MNASLDNGEKPFKPTCRHGLSADCSGARLTSPVRTLFFSSQQLSLARNPGPFFPSTHQSIKFSKMLTNFILFVK